MLGKGKVSEDGLAAEEGKATGIPIFAMVNVSILFGIGL